MKTTLDAVRPDLPQVHGPLPGPRARQIIERDRKVLSPSYTRPYPLVVSRGEGAMVEDVDGNRFLDFNAGIAVVATGHCHPKVVEAIQRQAASSGASTSATREPRPSRRPSSWRGIRRAAISSSRF